ncbi:ferritin-like domain-containing protein [Neisseria sp. Ec49-e6-T10]|uniref:ferritin-like domain-containing protein n=1 Tax=Neisseria sp. Ec49-e6-T10 TaxID=3140744 RepID=UPI003EC03108
MTKDSTLPWTLDDIHYDQINLKLIEQDETLMFLLAASSFVESGSDLYTSNLSEHYKAHPEICNWLNAHWEEEELQHGKALAKYVTSVWPDFDWPKAFEHFMAEYGPTCAIEALETDRGLEMVARCVVETGTSSLYRAIASYTKEPVLIELANHIRIDEVRHYKYFLQYFREYNIKQPIGRYKTTKAIYKRLKEIRDEDSTTALKHVFLMRYPDESLESEHFKRICTLSTKIVQQHLPIDTAVRMLLTPLALPKRLQRWIEMPVANLVKKALLN